MTSSSKHGITVPPGDFRRFVEYLSGPGLALAFAKTIVAPLDRLKLTYQVQAISIPNEKARFTSLLNFLKRVPAEQGFMALWRGNAINVFSIIPKSIIQFSFYENVRRICLSGGEQSYGVYELYARKLTSALTCGFLTLMFTYPIDIIRTRISVEQGRGWEDRLYKKFGQAWKLMTRREGRRSHYRGFLLSNLINLPYTLTFMLTYEMFRDMSNKGEIVQESTLSSVLNIFGIVSLCGCLAQTVVYPLDTIRRRIQVMDSKTGKVYNHSLNCLTKTVQKEGVKALYNGFGLNLVKILASSAAQVLIIKELKH